MSANGIIATRSAVGSANVRLSAIAGQTVLSADPSIGSLLDVYQSLLQRLPPLSDEMSIVAYNRKPLPEEVNRLCVSFMFNDDLLQAWFFDAMLMWSGKRVSFKSDCNVDSY